MGSRDASMEFGWIVLGEFGTRRAMGLSEQVTSC